MEFKADLHCHSSFSDGSDSPENLIELAREKGLGGLSITDHDTIGAYEQAMPYARSKNFPLLPGIEFSAMYKGEPIHILGYGYSLKSEAILQLCEKHRLRRMDRNRKILQRLKGYGISIDEGELLETPTARKTIGRPHIALVLMKRGIVESFKEAFDLYLGEGKKAYEPGLSISVEETVKAIHQGRGKAILAHPQLIKHQGYVKEVLKMGFDGLEGYYAKLQADQEARWIQYAQKHQWLITGGSDYHGTVKPLNTLGSSWVGEETFNLLYQHYLHVSSSA